MEDSIRMLVCEQIHRPFYNYLDWIYSDQLNLDIFLLFRKLLQNQFLNLLFLNKYSLLKIYLQVKQVISTTSKLAYLYFKQLQTLDSNNFYCSRLTNMLQRILKQNVLVYLDHKNLLHFKNIHPQFHNF